MKNIEQSAIHLVNELRKTQQDFASVNSEDINFIIYEIGKSITFNKLDLSKRDLRNVDFRDCFLGDFANFSNSDLRGAQFQSSVLDFVNFAGANLEGLQLQDTKMFNPDFDGTCLNGVNFEGADLRMFHPKGFNFNGAILPSDQYRVVKNTGLLIGPKLNYLNIDFRNFDLGGANLSESHFGKVNFQGMDLSTTNLSNAELFESDLRDVNLQGLDLTGVNLAGSDLRGANLSGAILNDFRFNLLISNRDIKMNKTTVLPDTLKTSLMLTDDSYVSVIFYNK